VTRHRDGLAASLRERLDDTRRLDMTGGDDVSR
jgi:hypothetical protein